ncbi:hypothetical protein BDV98DRAFT_573680 [Pterulicium gracile]|uniref:Secreted protein n=1 Tax=Pterulicium gracile TaxID=1884261 RepID=A0A5C3Q8P9_9AGAR|nr:hypothetical protein BDV98DRAFT_573680 [Pterula gracilis]
MLFTCLIICSFAYFSAPGCSVSAVDKAGLERRAVLSVLASSAMNGILSVCSVCWPDWGACGNGTDLHTWWEDGVDTELTLIER